MTKFWEGENGVFQMNCCMPLAINKGKLKTNICNYKRTNVDVFQTVASFHLRKATAGNMLHSHAK